MPRFLKSLDDFIMESTYTVASFWNSTTGLHKSDLAALCYATGPFFFAGESFLTRDITRSPFLSSPVFPLVLSVGMIGKTYFLQQLEDKASERSLFDDIVELSRGIDKVYGYLFFTVGCINPLLPSWSFKEHPSFTSQFLGTAACLTYSLGCFMNATYVPPKKTSNA